ncbi:hypothetical protein N9X24_03675 [Rickettsiales bacterium]|nr:hypothetical protein [Rickettsiales bacterium]
MKNQDIQKLPVQLIRLKLEGKNILALYINDSNNISLNCDLITKLNNLEEFKIINIKDNQNNDWEINRNEFGGFTFFNINNSNFLSLTSDDINYHGCLTKIC